MVGWQKNKRFLLAKGRFLYDSQSESTLFYAKPVYM